MTDKIVRDRELSDTQLVPDLLTGTDIGTWQAEYLLREVEFERLMHGKPVTYNWANSIALATFGFCLNIGAKGYSDISRVSSGEWVALAAGFGIAAILYLIGLALPDRRKEVIKNIRDHFEQAPTKRQVFKGESE
ncbi:hypothetical protein QWY74_00210 [Halomonas almeriensis]|uniref:hypothetical protein n=1 Tax=Halomonas almeriensis TaxID=308163 RepID=UPI0025B415B6|nr:hypothetical protein [Halomonas almeriensis]MDN3551904.1 hypothetical protein [Halomonas almeriensis]